MRWLRTNANQPYRLIKAMYATRYHLFCLLLLALLSVSCGQSLSPQEVAGKFWTGIEQSNARLVKRHITAADVVALKNLDDVLPISNPRLSRIVIEGETAYIDTTVTVDGDKPLEFPLKTHLVVEDGRWKVDYQRTIGAVANAGKLAAVIGKVHEFGAALQEGIDQSVKELEKTLPHIEQELSRIEDQIKQHVPELRQRLENFARELEDAIENPPKTTKPTEPGDPVEI